jgi:ElaB/YqjD/DUF883 family membrane-anchored ribosome-binding protein
VSESSPEQIKRDIERTRAELSNDVNVLSEKVTPSRIMQRRVRRTRDTVAGLKERIMGSNGGGLRDSTSDSARSAVSSAGDAVSSAKDTLSDAASSAPRAVRRQAEGNPLAAGLIAFGVGWLVSSLAPASQAEQQLATQVKDKASDVAQPLAQQAQQAAKEVATNLQEPAQQAVEQVKATAQDATDTVTEQAKGAASDVKDEARAQASG